MAVGTYSLVTSANLAKLAFQPKNMFGNKHRITIDLADLKTIKGSAPAGSDTYDIHLLNSWTHCKVVAMVVTVAVAGGSVSNPTIAVTDQSSNTYLAASSVSATAGTAYVGTELITQAGSPTFAVSSVSPGVFYTTANAVQIALGGTWTGATAGRVEIIVEVDEFGANSASYV